MAENHDEILVREATRIFLRLNQRPDDPLLIAAREDFLARGALERATYDEVERAWAVTGRRRRPSATLGIVFCLLFGASVYAAIGPGWTFFRSDFQTAGVPELARLFSGDTALLDAGSALIDETDGTERVVEVLEGAALFEVTPEARPFRVRVGPFEALVLGTTFETHRREDAVTVAVSEGRVEVRHEGRGIILSAGEQLRWSQGSEAAVTAIDIGTVASWRNDRLIVDGLSFSEVAEIIDRRLTGPVVILDAALAETRVSGGIDLSNPELALETLAASEAARVVSIGPLVTVVISSP